MKRKFILLLMVAALIAATIFLLIVNSNKKNTTNTNINKKHAQQEKDTLIEFNTKLYGKRFTTKTLLDCCINRKIDPKYILFLDSNYVRTVNYSIPTVYVYNKQGNKIETNICNCYFPGFIENIDKLFIDSISKVNNLQSISFLYDHNLKKKKMRTEKNIDYYILYFWELGDPKLIFNEIQGLQKEMYLNDTIKLYLVNYDNVWGYKRKDWNRKQYPKSTYFVTDTLD